MKMYNKIIRAAVAAFTVLSTLTGYADSIPEFFENTPEWHIGVNVQPEWIPATNDFLKGANQESRTVRGSFSGGLRADMSFNPQSRYGRLFPNLYQGIGIDVRSFSASRLLGTPISAYVYQGAPVAHISDRLWLGYEWQFGAAIGWKHDNQENEYYNSAISTSVTAHLGLGLKLHYSLSERWRMYVGIAATHFSNGNTSLPNAGVNAIGASIGMTYIINPQQQSEPASAELIAETDRQRWIFDITAFGAWRSRAIILNGSPKLCPGNFGVAGLQFSPMRKFNRWFAAGPALDIQYDESSGLAPYWIEGSFDENIKFIRPPFVKQLAIGLSAHSEFIMPIFTVNAGLGYNLLNPEGEKRFYQSLTLKTFVYNNIYLNVGYRLGNFKDPQNLMLGIGVRL